MSSRLVLALLLIGGCKSGSKSPPPPAVHDAAPAALDGPGAALTLDPERAYTLAEPEPGYTRFDRYDVELAAGDCKPSVTALASSGGAFAALAPSDFSVDRIVGTLGVRCGGPREQKACVEAACATLRAVPGGSAEEPYPTDPPVLSLSSGGGFSGQDRGGALVLPDGTVQFYGPKCARWRGRRGHLTSAARDGLFAAVTNSGFESMTESPRDEAVRLNECSDDVHTSVTWKHVTRTLGCKAVPALGTAVAAIEAALFPNPCY